MVFKRKGHRQKGGGTVQVSKGDSLRQGILCKEWQRTPIQLLSEYCQSKNRIKPYYHNTTAPGNAGYRSRCVLPDRKKKEKDLKFCPVQNFNSLDEAKHCAALLALHYVEPTRPLERKLPDPFRQVWLDLVNGVKEVVKVKKEAEKDKKEDNDSNGELEFWGDVEEESEQSGKKSIVLKADRKYASHDAFQQAKLVTSMNKNAKNRKFENRKRANPDVQVFMSEKCRSMVEEALGLKEMEKGSLSDVAVDAEDVKKLTQIGFSTAHANAALEYAVQKEEDAQDVLSSAMDWLCLYVPEDELPKSFNPAGTQLDVVANSQADTKVVRQLMLYGYKRTDCVHVMDLLKLTPVEDLELEASLQLFQQLLVTKVANSDRIIMEAKLDECEALRNEELETAHAIYDDLLGVTTHQLKSNGSYTKVVLNMGALNDANADSFVHFIMQENYPFELPCVMITCQEMVPSGFLSVITNLVQHCLSPLIGNPMIFEACSWLQENFHQYYTNSTGITLFKKLNTQKEMKKALPTAVKKQASVKKARKRIPTSPSKLDKELHSRTLLENMNSKKSKTFCIMQNQRSKLPAYEAINDILKLIASHQVLLIRGSTGCGKTTQVPQFILDDYIQRGIGGKCNIVCTQPRRIAAIGVATRVAQEREELIGDTVGYHIRMERRASAKTRLTFCTTGIFLRQLLGSRENIDVTHVIVDEVHERNVDTDFLLSVLRGLMPKMPNLKIILMSATMDTTIFQDYFNVATGGICPSLEIPGFTYPVDIVHLNEIIDMLEYQVPYKFIKKDKNKSKDGAPKIDESFTDYQLVAKLVEYICTTTDKKYASSAENRAILIFMPGVAEIAKTVNSLSRSVVASMLQILPLHGGLSAHDQAKVFQLSPKGKRKVIVSTNIAETSLTINDVVVVIDRGRVKEMQYDSTNKMSVLLDTWTSVASANQRKGRAGRVSKGHCFRLFSRKTENKEMPDQQVAEILRVSLEQLCLQIKLIRLGSIQEFLSSAIQPPKPEAAQASIDLLIEIGALTIDETLTPLGHHLSALPMDARIGKLLIYGCMLQCIDPVLTIAAGLSGRSLFHRSVEAQDSVALAKANFTVDKNDYMLYVRAYDSWKVAKNRRAYCKENYLSNESIENLHVLRRQFARDLESIGFLSNASSSGDKSTGSVNGLNTYSSKPRVIGAALCAGLYGNIMHVIYPEQKYYESAQGTIANTNQAKQIKYFLKSVENVAQRVFVHPSSLQFKTTYFSSPWLLFHSIVKTSKPFIRECAMVEPYAILLFGGSFEVEHTKNRIIMDKWIYFNAVPRISVLVKAIRQRFDVLLSAKISDPRHEIAHDPIIQAVAHLLNSNGLT